MPRLSYRLTTLLVLMHAQGALAQVSNQVVTDARSIGMASVGVTTAEGPGAAFFNPALLAFQKGPEIAVTVPVTQLVPDLSDDTFVRDFSVAIPLSQIPMSFGLHYRYLDYGIGISPVGGSAYNHYFDHIFGLSAAIQAWPFLSFGTRLQWLDLGTYDSSTASVDLGLLLSHRKTKPSGAFYEGRVGATLRRFGPDISSSSGSTSQDLDLLSGVSGIFGDRHARVVLAIDLVRDLKSEETFSDHDKLDVLCGAEVRMMTLSGRIGYEGVESIDDTQSGFGVLLPFPGNLIGSFDYGRRFYSWGWMDHYTLALRRAPEEHRRFEQDGYVVSSRFALGMVGAADSPADLTFNAGLYGRVSSRVGFTDGIDLETWFGWGLLQETQDEDRDSNSTFLNFGAGLRRNFDFGSVQPYGLFGLSASRLGVSRTEPVEPGGPNTKARDQLLIRGWTIGIGALAPQLMDAAGLDLGLLVHSSASFGTTWVELTLGASIP